EDVRFYIGMTQGDTVTALRTWKKIVGEPHTATEHLGAVLAQRLVRRLCQTCRIAFTPDAEALRKLNLPVDKVSQLYKSSGKVQVRKDREEPCPTCFGIGYRGRVAIFEVMVLDPAARKLAAESNYDQLRAHLR